jgi:hypothetical protein
MNPVDGDDGRGDAVTDADARTDEALLAIELLDRVVLSIPPECWHQPTARDGVDVAALVAHAAEQLALVPAMVSHRSARARRAAAGDARDAWVRTVDHADAALRAPTVAADARLAGYLVGLAAELWACLYDLAEATGATDQVIRSWPRTAPANGEPA